VDLDAEHRTLVSRFLPDWPEQNLPLLVVESTEDSRRRKWDEDFCFGYSACRYR
jgi:hypothetical protein